MITDIVNRLRSALPSLRQWIDDYVADHATQAKAIDTLGHRRLASYYPDDLLARTQVVAVPRVLFPPVDRFGLPEFAAAQQMPFAGITFCNTFFVRQGQESESLYFHEMVHVVQWARLGFDNFLMAYGIGLLQHPYEQSPLEHMAYSLQRQFDHGTPLPNLVALIQQQTDIAWQGVAPLLDADVGTQQALQADHASRDR